METAKKRQGLMVGMATYLYCDVCRVRVGTITGEINIAGEIRCNACIKATGNEVSDAARAGFRDGYEYAVTRVEDHQFSFGAIPIVEEGRKELLQSLSSTPRTLAVKRVVSGEQGLEGVVISLLKLVSNRGNMTRTGFLTEAGRLLTRVDGCSDGFATKIDANLAMDKVRVKVRGVLHQASKAPMWPPVQMSVV